MSTECRPCFGVRCENILDTDVYSLDGAPPSVAPPAPPVPEPYVSDAVYFPMNCAIGTAIAFVGVLPGWVTIDLVNNQLVGAAGTFRGQTTADATDTAQAALNSFGNYQVALGNLICASAVNCPGTDTNTYGITGYFDGMVLNSIGDPPFGGETVWDGVFNFQLVVDPCVWLTHCFGINSLLMNGNVLCQASISFTSGRWELVFYAGLQVLWKGLKLTGTDPSGVYAWDSGFDLVPLTLTVALVGPGATPCADLPSCSPT